MKVVETIDEVRACVAEARAAGKVVGLVATMGALHAGHVSLVNAARASSGLVVVSIFVNPTQFGPTEDFSRYPRTPQADIETCRRNGADVVFMPGVETIYGPGGKTEVRVRDLGETLCGRSRPGHFAGVCTVVGKLFNIVAPDRAFFGAKDYQQATIIRRMTADLNFPVEIVVCPTVREADGLAMSSRNAYLTPSERQQATALYESLCLAEWMIRQAHPPADEVIAAMRAHLTSRSGGAAVDYVQIVDPDTLQDVQSTSDPVLLALAVRFGQTRLIDNMRVG